MREGAGTEKEAGSERVCRQTDGQTDRQIDTSRLTRTDKPTKGSSLKPLDWAFCSDSEDTNFKKIQPIRASLGF